MKTDYKKVIPYLAIVVFALSASVFIPRYYFEKVTTHFKDVKERSIDEYVESKKKKSEEMLNHLSSLFKHRDASVDEEIKIKLQSRVDKAYKSARYIHKKYRAKKGKREIKERIKDALKQMNYGDREDNIYITGYSGKNVLSRVGLRGKKNIGSYADADGRAIFLEEIQKVRRRGGGYIQSNFYDKSSIWISLVKDLDIYSWYIGSAIDISKQKESLKQTLLEMLQAIPIDSSEFMGIYDLTKVLYLSSKDKDLSEQISKNLSKKSSWYVDKQDRHYHIKYYEPFDWYMVYGFDISDMKEKEFAKEKELKNIF